MYYGGARRSRVWCALVLGGTLVIWGALEAALIFALRVRGLSFFLSTFHVLNIAVGTVIDCISLRIEVVRPPAKLACASSGSWVLP